MSLDFEEYDPEPDECAGLRGAGREGQPKAMTTTYTGVGDDLLAVPDLVCGLAEPLGLGAVGAHDDGSRHPLQP